MYYEVFSWNDQLALRRVGNHHVLSEGENRKGEGEDKAEKLHVFYASRVLVVITRGGCK